MLAAMPQANEPVGPPGRPYPQSESRKLGVPDAILALQQRQFSPSEIAVEKGTPPTLFAIGDHKSPFGKSRMSISA